MAAVDYIDKLGDFGWQTGGCTLGKFSLCGGRKGGVLILFKKHFTKNLSSGLRLNAT